MRKIRIKNFRSLVMENPIEIRPLTLFFGKNGSGKSSFIKALRFLGQNLTRKALQKSVYQLDEEVFLGDFKEIVNKNDLSKKIEFEIEESFISNRDHIHYKLSAKFCDNNENRNLESLVISDLFTKSSFTILPNKVNKIGVENLAKLEHNGQSLKEFRESISNLDHLGFEIPGLEVYYDYSPSINFYRKLNHQNNRVKKLFEQADILPFYDNYASIKHGRYFQYLCDKNKSVTNLMDEIIKTYYKNIPRCLFYFLNWFYIGQIRKRPDYFYKLNEYGEFSRVDYYGFLKQLDDSEGKLESEKHNLSRQLYKSVNEFINEKLQGLKLGQGIRIKKNKNLGSIYFIDNNGTEVNLAEASSGVIQILPILLKSYFLYEDHLKDSLSNYMGYQLREGFPVMLLEQPELHLHPELQTRFIKLLVKSWSNFIIETHSEHIIRKIQVLIANGLPKEKVAVYYFDKNEKTSITSIKEMELDEKGRFKEDWPDGFFDTDVQNTLDFFRAISKN